MSHSRVILQPAYVLHQRPYRDTSVLLEVFTRDMGRVGLVAKGARAEKSRLRGLLQPFQSLLISWTGRGELVTLIGCEAVGTPRRLSGQTLISGFYLNELIMRLLHRHDAHPDLFQSYADALLGLQGPGQERRALRIFEKRLLHELGYALMLEHEAGSAAPLVENATYSYELEKGPVRTDAPKPYDIALRGHSLISLASEELRDDVSLREAKRLTRAALAIYLGDKPLQSRKLLADFHKGNDKWRPPGAAPASLDNGEVI